MTSTITPMIGSISATSLVRNCDGTNQQDVMRKPHLQVVGKQDFLSYEGTQHFHRDGPQGSDKMSELTTIT